MIEQTYLSNDIVPVSSSARNLGFIIIITIIITLSAMEKLHNCQCDTEIPRIFRVKTRSIVTSGNSGTSCAPRLCGFRKIILYDFLQFEIEVVIRGQGLYMLDLDFTTGNVPG